MPSRFCWWAISFIHSWGPIQEHVPRVPPVHLPGCPGVPDVPKSHWLCLLWGPEVEEWSISAAEKTLYCGNCSPTSAEEPHRVHGGHRHHRPFCPATDNPPLHGWICGWLGQLFWRSSAVLPGSVHGGTVGQIDQIHSRDTDITHNSQTVSGKNNFAPPDVCSTRDDFVLLDGLFLMRLACT